MSADGGSINHVNLARETTGDARFDPNLGCWADLGPELRASAAEVVPFV